MYKTLLFCCLFIFSSLTALSNIVKMTTPVSVIEKNMPELHSVQCKFSQSRTIGSKTLKSSGDFQFIEGKGVIFNTVYPVKSVTAYTSKNNRFINDIILSVSGKNLSILAKQFDMYFNQTKNDWYIFMTAKDSKVKSFIEAVKISGKNNFIYQIEIWHLNPTAVTDIRFYFEE